MRSSLKDLVHIALCAAILCAVCPFSIPLSVPLSLGTFCVMAISLIFGWVKGVAATAVYLALGAAGLPVFTRALGGVGVLAGPTGGYLAGYLFLAFCCGLLYRRGFWPNLGMVILGNLLLYTFGTLWFMHVQGSALAPALMACVVPFLPGDALKVAAAFWLRHALVRRRLF